MSGSSERWINKCKNTKLKYWMQYLDSKRMTNFTGGSPSQVSKNPHFYVTVSTLGTIDNNDHNGNNESKDQFFSKAAVHTVPPTAF